MKSFLLTAKKIFSPPLPMLAVLTPISAALLICALIYLEPEHIGSIVSYALSVYTLTALCFRMPTVVRRAKRFKENNRYVQRLTGDVRYRLTLTMYGSLIYNVAYSVFQLALGFKHHSVWFYALAAYYALLAAMRASLVSFLRRGEPGRFIRRELVRYRLCGIILLVMNTALTTIIFFIVWQGRTFVHHQITTIAMAAYTFTSFTFAIINTVKYRKYRSPIYSASKIVSLTAALVSMLTLTTTMLTVFGEPGQEGFYRLMTALTGAAVSVTVLTLAVLMLVGSTKKLRAMEKTKTKLKCGYGYPSGEKRESPDERRNKNGK